MKLTTLLLVGLMSSSLANSAIVSSLNSEARLLDHVFANYSPKVRPILNHSQPVKVELDLMLRQIIDVDMVDEVLTTNVWIRMFWKSELTTWDPSEFGGLTSITVEPKLLWVPDLVIYNRVSTSETGGGSLYKTIDTNVILEHTGEVTWLSPAILKTECVIDVRYFPFDSHQCLLTVGSWAHHQGKILMNATRNVIDIENYSYDKEWRLVATKVVSQSLKFNCCSKLFSSITFSLLIKRRPIFYVFNLIIPCGLITVLSLFSFLLPPNSGERVSFVMTVLLSLSVYMLIVTEKIPQSADIPISSKLFMCMMVEISLSLVATCFIIRIHNYNMPMPPSFKMFVNGWLARVLHMKKEREVKNEGERNSRKEASKNSEKNQGFGKDDDDDIQITREYHPQNRVDINDAVQEENKEKQNATKDIFSQSRLRIREPEADVDDAEAAKKRNEISNFFHKFHGNEKEDLQSEWIFASKVLDRFFILTFFLSICTTFMWISFAAPGEPVFT